MMKKIKKKKDNITKKSLVLEQFKHKVSIKYTTKSKININE